MRILELRSENFQRIKAVAIRPDGNLIEITGKNGNGKTSTLDSIAVVLGGKALAPAAPIRKGADQATIGIDLGDKTVELIVTRTFKRSKENGEYTTSLTVESPDGGVFRSPQRMLDTLLGELSFDPLVFARAKPAEQIDMLKRLVPGVDFDAIERQNAADYEKRRDLNREAKSLRAQAAGIPVPADVGEAVDEDALVAKLDEAGEHNAEIERRKARREKVSGDIEQLEREAKQHTDRAAELRRQADEAQQAAQQAVNAAAALSDKLANAEPLPDPIDTSTIRSEIAAARAHNDRVADARQRRKLDAEAEDLEQQSETLTEAMEARNTAKAEAIAAANLPVPGLAFGAGEVTLGGVPFEQASSAEKLRASVAIAAAMNPKLRAVRVFNGNDLDDDSLKLLEQFAEEHDLQVWLERIHASGKVGFVIEDGALVKQSEDAA